VNNIINYISTAQFYQPDDQNIRCHHNISHYSKANCNLASRNFFRRIFSGQKFGG